MSFRKFQFSLVDLMLTLAGLYGLFLGLEALSRNDAVVGATGATLGLVLLFAATLDRFESFKGLGIEAKTRKLEATINRAEDTLDQIRQLHQLVGTTMIDLNARVGRYDSVSPTLNAYALAQQVRENFIAVGISEAVIRKALKPWARTAAFDMVMATLKKVYPEQYTVHQQLNQEAQRETDLNRRQLIAAEASAVTHYYAEQRKILSGIAFEDMPKALETYLSEMPGLAHERKKELLDLHAPIIRQLRILVEKLDFDDPKLWSAADDSD